MADVKIRDIAHLKAVFAGLALHPDVPDFMRIMDGVLPGKKPAIAIAAMLLLVAYSSDHVAPLISEENIVDMLTIAFDFHRAARVPQGGADLAKRDAELASDLAAILKRVDRG